MKSKILKKTIAQKFPEPFVLFLRKCYYLLSDTYENLFSLRGDLIPPKRMIFVGVGDFEMAGKEFLRYFVEYGGLKKSDRILDVGSGIGRMAVPLTTYLDQRGSYEGIDIVSKGIDWCKKKITPKYPNFKFHLADIYNKYYNPQGKFKSSEYKFPFEDKIFDFIFLTSVFTHMLPDDINNYLFEISRTLKDNGKCLFTVFLLNDESIESNVGDNLILDFKYIYENYRIVNIEKPEAAISFNENFIRQLLENHNLKIVEPIHYGSWCQRKSFLSFQDIIVIEKVLS